MNKLKTNLLFIVAIVVLLATACDKETPVAKCKQVSESPQDFLDYWYFSEGSWWVYELKGNPGVYDTVRVTEQRKYYADPCKKVDCGGDFFECSMIYKTILSHSNIEFFVPIGTYKVAIEEYSAQYSIMSPSGLQNASQLFIGHAIFIHPANINQTISQFAEVADTNQVITPLGIFNNTIHIRLLPWNLDTTQYGFAKDFYFTKHVGLTRRVYTGNQTWELVDYFINR